MITKNKKQKNQKFPSYNFFPKNHKGWIRIIEAFVAILLVAGVLLIVINKGDIGKKDISSTIYDVEISILREIQLNDALRNDILSVTPPVEWNDTNFPLSIKNKIIDRIPAYLDCEAKICFMDEICELNEYPKKDVYAQSVAITATLQTPEEEHLKQLKLFCWI
jgi:hypothetical protein